MPYDLKVLIGNNFSLGTGINLLRKYSYENPDEDTPVGTSKLNTPVYDNLIIQAGSYLNEDGQTVEYDELRLDIVLFTVRQSKNIVKTLINGRNGTIKEFVSDGDFDINIRGAITSDYPNFYPEEQVLLLKNILKVPDSLKVTSRYLNRLDIFEIVITDYALDNNEKWNNVQFFNINALSEIPYEIRRKDEQ